MVILIDKEKKVFYERRAADKVKLEFHGEKYAPLSKANLVRLRAKVDSMSGPASPSCPRSPSR